MPNTKGFTLIELLVVIAIIGIMISIVAESYSNAKNSAKDKVAPCDTFSEQTYDSIPVRCLEHFGVRQVK